VVDDGDDEGVVDDGDGGDEGVVDDGDGGDEGVVDEGNNKYPTLDKLQLHEIKNTKIKIRVPDFIYYRLRKIVHFLDNEYQLGYSQSHCSSDWTQDGIPKAQV